MSSEILCRICSLPVYKSPTPHAGYYKVKSNGEVKDAQIDLGGERFHKKCAKCSKCKCYLLADNFQKDENLILFCTEHFVGNTNAAGAAVVSNGDSAKAIADVDAEAAAEKVRIDAEEKAKVEEKARLEAISVVEEKARVDAEEKARLEAIAIAEKDRLEGEEKARLETIAVADRARLEGKEKARLEAIAVAEKIRIEAEEKARLEAEEKTKIEAIAAAEKARLETEEKTRVEAAAAVAASAVLSDKGTISPPSKPPRKSGANDANATPRSPVLTARSTGGNDTARSADSTVNETTSAPSSIAAAGLVAATGVIIAATTDESNKDKEPIAVTHDDNSTTSAATITAEQQAALEFAEYEKAQAILAADALMASEKEKKRVEEAVAAAEKARLEVEAKMKSDAEIAARETAEAAAVALAALAAQKEAETKAAENTAFEISIATAENSAHVPIPPSTFVSPRGEETLAVLSPPQPPSTSQKTSEKNNTDAMEIGLLAAGATVVAAIAAVAVASSSSPRVEPSTTESTTESTYSNVTATPEAATATATSSKVGGGILDRVKSFNQSPADKAAAAESSIQMSAGRGGSGSAAVLGDNVITKMSNMADEYTANGAYEPAEQMYTKCLGARRTKLGEDHEETLLNRSKLASLYTKWNKPAKAEEMYLKVYEIKKEKYGKNDAGTLIAMSELADFYANPSSKEYKKAEELYLPCLELNKIKYGEDADETVAVMDSLATLYRLQENKSKATFYLEKCVELKTKKYGSQNTVGSGNENVLNSIIRLAENYYESQRYDKCEPLYIQIHSMKKAKLSESDDETMKYLLFLGHTYKEQRKYAEATPVYETYLDLQVKKLGESHKETLGTMSYLLTYFALPENKIFERCEAVHLRRLKIYQDLYDDDNKETIQARVDIIAFYKSYKKSTEIEKFYLALLAVYQNKYGVADVKKTLPLREEIAAWYKEEGSSKFTEAEKIFIDIYNTKRSSTSNELGEVHASTLTSLQAIIDLYENSPNGVQLESVEMWTLKGYEIRRERLGENHEDTLKAQLALAMVYKRMKKWSDGEKLLIKYVEVNKTKYGATSPEATEAIRVLAEFRAQMKLESPAAGCACAIS